MKAPRLGLRCNGLPPPPRAASALVAALESDMPNAPPNIVRAQAAPDIMNNVYFDPSGYGSINTTLADARVIDSSIE